MTSLDNATDRSAWLDAHAVRGATCDDALAFFDACAPVAAAEMIGRWRGSGLPTGHHLDGLLERFGWYGKAFHDAEHVDPLLFVGSSGAPFAVSPRWMPLKLAEVRAIAHASLTPPFVRLLMPLLRTRHSAARLRTIEYRGSVTATMIYDARPIHDVFRRVDATRLLGVMDQRGAQQPFFFVLTAER